MRCWETFFSIRNKSKSPTFLFEEAMKHQSDLGLCLMFSISKDDMQSNIESKCKALASLILLH